MNKLAISGGQKTVTLDQRDMFRWPVFSKETDQKVLQVLHDGNMSGTDITKKFEHVFADWMGVKYALGHCNGTAALQAAMYGTGLGIGDEIICPSITYWASCTQALALGASVVFADIDPVTLCIDPNDIEKRITPRTKAIMVVHYLAMPADMDRIMAIAGKHNLKVIEDVSHAHGALYKGRKAGSIGDVAGYSLMSGKSLAVGEGGILTTNNRDIYERAIVFGHYERGGELTNEKLKAGAGIPWGGYKYRMHQISSAVAIEQLKKYPAEIAEIDKAMNYFWDLLEGVPGIRAHRPEKNSGTTKGGWYASVGHYMKDELGGLSIKRFCEAVTAEGVPNCHPGCNAALHTHPVFNTIDVYNAGRPSNYANIPGKAARKQANHLPVTDGIQEKVFSIPWFKHFRKNIIKQHADAFIKVVENHKDLLAGQDKETAVTGRWALSARKN